MTGWPAYWDGMPPMYNATHAISPTLALRRNEAEYVSCLGSGRIFERMHRHSTARRSPSRPRTSSSRTPTSVPRSRDRSVGRRAAVPRELRRLRQRSDLRVDAGRGRGPRHPHRGEAGARSQIPDFAHLLPEPIRRFTTGGRLRLRAATRPPVLHPGRRPRRLAPAPGAPSSLHAIVEARSPTRTPCRPPTSPARASSRTTPPSGTAIGCICRTSRWDDLPGRRGPGTGGGPGQPGPSGRSVAGTRAGRVDGHQHQDDPALDRLLAAPETRNNVSTLETRVSRRAPAIVPT